MVENQKKAQVKQELMKEHLNKKLKQLDSMRFLEKKKKVQKKKKQFVAHGLNVITND